MQAPAIRAIDAAEAEDAFRTLTLAFGADPCTRYIWPKPGAFLTGYPRLLHAVGGAGLERGRVFATDDFSAAALWLPPGVKPDSEAIDALIAETVSAERIAVAAQVGDGMDAHHPAEPHWYLSMIGVDPARQGRGLGSALLAHCLARLVDAEGAVAYLESSNSRNTPLYERFGFEATGHIAPADFPGLTPMVRAAQR